MLLHQKLRSVLARDIYQGVYEDGALLPTERELAQKHKVSRVTVRGTLARMQGEGLIVRRQGHGTRVKLRKSGFPGDVDTIAVIAPVQNPFFASFIYRLDDAADAHGGIVVFKAAGGRPMEDALFRFYERNIRNIVVWPYDEVINIESFVRLRGLGMNIVIFDRIVHSGMADCVSVDNADAIKALYRHLRAKCGKCIAYIGWENDVLTSNAEREKAFIAIGGEDSVCRLPWRKEQGVDRDVAAVLRGIPRDTRGILCGNGVIGIAVGRYCAAHQRNVRVACVDDLPGAEALALTAYVQPMEALAGLAHQRLARQNAEADQWKAKTVYARGRLAVRD
jgi:DNA-binding LacI/PurR family transcriptional regulator